jgi:hypothetical protein
VFIGHFAVGFASKRFAPKASLGPLMAAPLLVDLIWPVLLLTGAEQVQIDPGNTAFTPLDFISYPYTHSLLGCLGWAVLFAACYWLTARYRRGAVVIFCGVLSHWLLDWLTHRPDLPLYPGGPKVGLGLWNSVPATMAVETALFAAGVWIYIRTTHPIDRTGRISLAAFLAVLITIYVGNAYGPPPPSAQAIAWTALGLWLFPLWCWQFDRHRVAQP